MIPLLILLPLLVSLVLAIPHPLPILILPVFAASPSQYESNPPSTLSSSPLSAAPASMIPVIESISLDIRDDEEAPNVPVVEKALEDLQHRCYIPSVPLSIRFGSSSRFNSSVIPG